MSYRFVVDDEVLDAFMRLPCRSRERLFKLIPQIADDAPRPADTSHRDSAGRPIMKRTFNGWAIWFW